MLRCNKVWQEDSSMIWRPCIDSQDSQLDGPKVVIGAAVLPLVCQVVAGRGSCVDAAVRQRPQMASLDAVTLNARRAGA